MPAKKIAPVVEQQQQEETRTSVSARPSGFLSANAKFGLSKFAIIWLILSGLICIIDATFVIFRPGSLPGGNLVKYFPVWIGWHQYIQHDKRYADLHDAWVVLQSYMNLVEVALQFLCVYLNKKGNFNLAHKIFIVISICTFYKTVIYFGMEVFEGFPFTKHNSNKDLLLMVIIPSSFWVIIPFYLAVESLGKLSVTGLTKSA
jgi:hypothetical protein